MISIFTTLNFLLFIKFYKHFNIFHPILQPPTHFSSYFYWFADFWDLFLVFFLIFCLKCRLFVLHHRASPGSCATNSLHRATRIDFSFLVVRPVIVSCRRRPTHYCPVERLLFGVSLPPILVCHHTTIPCSTHSFLVCFTGDCSVNVPHFSPQNSVIRGFSFLKPPHNTVLSPKMWSITPSVPHFAHIFGPKSSFLGLSPSNLEQNEVLSGFWGPRGLDIRSGLRSQIYFFENFIENELSYCKTAF